MNGKWAFKKHFLNVYLGCAFVSLLLPCWNIPTLDYKASLGIKKKHAMNGGEKEKEPESLIPF
jgi:hypothetical protein